jgi:hypothetical protein
MQFRPAARSHRQKAAILARFKGNNTPRAPLFSACVRMTLVLVNSTTTRENKVFGPPSALGDMQAAQSSTSRENVEHPTPSPDLFLISSDFSWEEVPSSRRCGCGPVWRQVQLTTHSRHWALGSVVLPSFASPSTSYYQLRGNCQLPAASYQQQPTTRPQPKNSKKRAEALCLCLLVAGRAAAADP